MCVCALRKCGWLRRKFTVRFIRWGKTDNDASRSVCIPLKERFRQKYDSFHMSFLKRGQECLNSHIIWAVRSRQRWILWMHVNLFWHTFTLKTNTNGYTMYINTINLQKQTHSHMHFQWRLWQISLLVH